MSLEVHKFQTEVTQLLNLMIHSLYSNKEIFLRELISNASDAIDKAKFEEITNKTMLLANGEACVKVTGQPEQNVLIIEDNGIGMTKEELLSNLGTIANSGTKKFLEKLNEQDKKDANLIGQFGVGFYSAFMVADKIVVETKSGQNTPAYKWISSGDGTFSIEESGKETRGTRVELHLKEESKEFAEDNKIKEIVKKYSDYVTYPVFLVDKENKEERLNKSTPVWAKAKKDNTNEDYIELYRQLSKDYRDPLLWEHINIEGTLPFKSVVYIPEAAPFDLYTRDTHGLHLYVKRVSISEKCKELLPEYLRFVCGVVETDDLPLNVSREILQQNTKIPQIKKQVVKKIFSALTYLAQNDKEKYEKFYNTFGAVLKEGFHFDFENHATLAELARFKSSKTGKEGFVSFQEYTERFAAGQKEIYYVTGMNFESLEKSPHLEEFNSRGIEVLFLTDPIDEWFLMSFPKYKDFELKPVNKGEVDLKDVGTSEEEVSNKEPVMAAEELAPLIDLFRNKLSNTIKDVKISKRLRESACCLVADQDGMTAQMERLMRASGQAMPPSKKILEINPSHPLIKNLAKKKNTGATEDSLANWVEVLYDTALLSEGSQIENPGSYAKKLTKIMEEASAAH